MDYGHTQLKKTSDGKIEDFYRYEAKTDDNNNVRLTAARFEVLRETPRGVVVKERNAPAAKERFINLYVKKRYCHETKEFALEAFMARKQRYFEILTYRRLQCGRCMQAAQAELQRLNKRNAK